MSVSLLWCSSAVWSIVHTLVVDRLKGCYIQDTHTMADRLAIKCNWKRANIYMITNTVYYTLVITDQRPDRVGLALQWHFAAGESSLFGSVQHFGRSNGKSLPILPSRRLQKRPWRHNKVHSSHRHGPSQRDPQPVQSNRSRIRLQQPCTHQSGISLFFSF